MLPKIEVVKATQSTAAASRVERLDQHGDEADVLKLFTPKNLSFGEIHGLKPGESAAQEIKVAEFAEFAEFWKRKKKQKGIKNIEEQGKETDLGDRAC